MGEAGFSIELWAECAAADHRIYKAGEAEGECGVYPRLVLIGTERCILKARFCGG